jgi:hypothetical protein
MFSLTVFDLLSPVSGQSSVDLPFRSAAVPPAFRRRFTSEWNAKLTVSKGVNGVFRPRFAEFKN